MTTERTKTKLARALRLAGLPETLATRAEAGEFDDYESEFDNPQMHLVEELRKHPSPEATALIDAVYEGTYDGTREEADAWASSPEGRAAFRNLLKGP